MDINCKGSLRLKNNWEIDVILSFFFFRGRRLAKNLLKDQRTSLTLWNAYAQMEKSHDRIDEVR